MIALSHQVFMTMDTFSSLQIFRAELHPNGQMKDKCGISTMAKENLSIFGLFRQLTSTSQGRARLRRDLLRPTMDLGILSARQNAISFLLKKDNQEALLPLRRFLRGMQDAKTLLKRMETGSWSIASHRPVGNDTWKALWKFTVQAVGLHACLEQLLPTPSILTQVWSV